LITVKTNTIFAALFLSAGAFAGPITYTATLSGANENPAVVSGGTGTAIVTIDTILQTMEINVVFFSLNSGDTASHIHCCVPFGGNAGVATITPTFTGFPSGVTSGSYDHTFDLTDAGTYNPAFITSHGTLAAAEAALLAGLANDQTYLNIHTSSSPNGEIRGFLVQTPEPSTFALVGGAIAGLALLVRKRQRS
jgi:CHRD domain/PEP-CTERM motif